MKGRQVCRHLAEWAKQFANEGGTAGEFNAPVLPEGQVRFSIFNWVTDEPAMAKGQKGRNPMRKLLTLTLTLALLALCIVSPAEEALTVGIIQMADNGAFTDMREGYIARMQEKGYTEDKMSFLYQNAQGDMSNLSAICQNMIDEKVDFAVTVGTPPSQAFLNMDSDIPFFFISVSNPVKAGIITDMQKPDKNATGASNFIPVSEIFTLADTLTPGVKTYGLIYCASEINSVSTINQAKEYLDANGLAYVEAVVANSGEVAHTTESLLEQVDAIFCPNDSVVQTAMPALAELAADAGIPVYGSSAVMVNSGALATVSIDDRAIGALVADMSIQYLAGTPITDIPAVVVDTFTTVVNATTAETLQMDIGQVSINNLVVVP